ncbi:MAG TPA: hypothetical protein PLV89_00295 [Treponemataceae bacterium]|nr:hypothetical protein [Treponemataceae bacterium]
MKKIYLLITAVVLFCLCCSCQNNKNNKANVNEAGDESSNNFSVINYEPSGILPAGMKYPSVFVQFSKPVVALQKLGEVMTSSPPYEYRSSS